MTFINKYWKVIVIILFLLNIGLLVKQEFTNANNDVLREQIKTAIDNNTKRNDAITKRLDELNKRLDTTTNKVITRTIHYETQKKTPVIVNMSDPELVKRLQSFESKYGIK